MLREQGAKQEDRHYLDHAKAGRMEAGRIQGTGDGGCQIGYHQQVVPHFLELPAVGRPYGVLLYFTRSGQFTEECLFP
jgi:hypothetical protein